MNKIIRKNRKNRKNRKISKRRSLRKRILRRTKAKLSNRLRGGKKNKSRRMRRKYKIKSKINKHRGGEITPAQNPVVEEAATSTPISGENGTIAVGSPQKTGHKGTIAVDSSKSEPSPPPYTKEDPLKPKSEKKKQSKKKKWGPIPDSILSSVILKDGNPVKYCGDNCINHLNERLVDMEGLKDCWF